MHIRHGNRPRITRSEIATHTGLPDDVAAVCHRVLASREEMHPWLAENPELDDDVWLKLWGSKRPESELARRLVSRPLNKDLRAVVIDRENRVGVLTAFIEHNRLLPEEQRLLSGKANARAALLHQRWLEPNLRKPLAVELGGIHLLREMALSDDGVFAEDEIVDLLGNYPDWIGDLSDPRKGAADRNRFLRILFGRHPGAVEPAITNPRLTGRCRSEILTSAAGSANLLPEDAARIARVDEHGICCLTPAQAQASYYCLLALLGNPRCPHRVAQAVLPVAGRHQANVADAAKRRLEKPEIVGDLSEIDDPETLDWLARRALPYRGQDSTRAGRPLELLALARNPHIGKDIGKRIAGCIPAEVESELVAAAADELRTIWPDIVIPDEPGTPVRESKPWPAVTAAMELAVEKLGHDQSRWETLIGLLDDFDGTFEELVSLAETI